MKKILPLFSLLLLTGLAPQDKPAIVLEEVPKVSAGNIQPRTPSQTFAPTCPRDLSITPEPSQYISLENPELKHCLETNCRIGVYTSREGSDKRFCSYCEKEEKE